MAYTPLVPDVLRPGLPGDSQLGTLLDNVDGAFVDYGPPIFGPCACSLESQSVTDVLVAEIDLPDNEDNVLVYCRIRWRGTTGYTATVTFEIDDGGTVDTDTDTSTTSSWAGITLAITPTSTNTPRVARLYLRTSTAGQVAQIASVLIGYAPASTPTGILESGFGHFDGTWVGDFPIPSEVIERAHNNLRAIARSRPAGLAGGITRVDAGGTPASGPVYEVTGTTWTLVERWLQPGSDEGRRWYRLCMLLSGSGSNPEARMSIGPYVWAVAGDGWHEQVVQLSLNEAMRCAIYLRNSGGGDAVLHTWQVQRARPPVTYAAVAALYRSPGAAGDYADAEVGETLFPGGSLGVFAISFWVKAVAATDGIPFDLSDDGAPGLRLDYASGELQVTLTDDTAASVGGALDYQTTDGDWHHVFITSRDEADSFDSNGTQIWYDGITPDDGLSSLGTFTVAASVLRLFADYAGANRFPGDIANVATFSSLPPHVEIAALAAAGVTHDVRNPSGRWRRRKPEAYYRDADTAGVVANVGKLVAALVFNGDVTSEAL